MRASDILKVKGNALFTVTPDMPLADAVATMADRDLGSLVVMEQGRLMGMLTFREILYVLRIRGGNLGETSVRDVMEKHPLICAPDIGVDDVRRMMLGNHTRYMPVMEGALLMGVISFYDVAKTVVEQQGFENRMLKAYIRDWPGDEREATG